MEVYSWKNHLLINTAWWFQPTPKNDGVLVTVGMTIPFPIVMAK
jgi:hypothetical protein